MRPTAILQRAALARLSKGRWTRVVINLTASHPLNPKTVAFAVSAPGTGFSAANWSSDDDYIATVQDGIAVESDQFAGSSSRLTFYPVLVPADGLAGITLTFAANALSEVTVIEILDEDEP